MKKEEYSLQDTINHRFLKDYWNLLIPLKIKSSDIEKRIKDYSHRLNNLLTIPYSQLVHERNKSKEDFIKEIKIILRDLQKENIKLGLRIHKIEKHYEEISKNKIK